MTYTIKLNNNTYREASPCDVCHRIIPEHEKRCIVYPQKSIDVVCKVCYYLDKESKQQRRAQEVVL